MKNSIYDFTSYKEYLIALISSYPNSGRGQRKALAESVGCQLGYITHVLSGQNDFSLEQAEAAARHFSLSSLETEFLLFLVQSNRAGTESLKEIFENKLDQMRETDMQLNVRLKIRESLDSADQATYYQSWQYAAVHMLLTIPEFQIPEKIVDKLGISPSKVSEILEFLYTKGLATKALNRYTTTTPLLHLERESAMVSKHHTNWRIRTLQSLDNMQRDDLHYSLVFSIAESDLPKIRDVLTKALESCAEVIKPSKEETLAALCIDFYKI